MHFPFQKTIFKFCRNFHSIAHQLPIDTIVLAPLPLGRASLLSYTFPTSMNVYEDAIGANCDATFQYHAAFFQPGFQQPKYHGQCAKYRHSRPQQQLVEDVARCIEGYDKISDLDW